MSHLSQLQSDFQAYLLDANKGAAFTKQIVNDKKVGVKKRLGIYADAYRLRIIEALANSYPILKALLGDDLFEKVALKYIEQYPSTYRNMRWVGDKMSEHLQANFPQYPIAAEMAAFEWGLSLAFDAEDTPILTLQHLAKIAPENWGAIQLKAHPSLQLLAFNYNVLPMWQALNAEQTPPAIINLQQNCVVWRQQLNSHYRSIEPLEKLVLKQVILGISFGALCEFIQAQTLDINANEEAAMQTAAQFLSGWLSSEVILFDLNNEL